MYEDNDYAAGYDQGRDDAKGCYRLSYSNEDSEQYVDGYAAGYGDRKYT